MTKEATTPTPEAPKVYAAIAAVMRDIGVEGIDKTRKNQGQGFNFRGIDEIYAALNPIMVKHHLMILPRCQDGIREHLTTAKGGHMNSVVLPVEYDLVCALDGSVHTIRVVGEAQDSGDKATNKAMSAALKYACLQAFMIPLKGVPDSDEETPEPTRRPLTDRERTAQAAWQVGVLEKIANASSNEDLDTLKRSGPFKQGYGKLDAATQEDIRKAFHDRSMDFEPPLEGDK